MLKREVSGASLNAPAQARMRPAGREVWLAASLLVALVALVLTSLGTAARIQSNYSISQFLPANHPLLSHDREIRTRFFLDQSQPFLITLTLPNASHGDWLTSRRLRELSAASDRLKALEGAHGVLSLGNVPVTSQGHDDVTVGRLSGLENETLRRTRVRDDRLLNPMLISNDSTRTVVVVATDENISNEKMAQLMNEARAILQSSFPEAEIAVGGVPAIQTQLSAMVRSELGRFSAMALVACCMSLLLVFSSLSSVAVPFVAILLTNILVLALMSIMGMAMTVLAVTIPILVSVTVLSLSIHSMLRFAEDVEADRTGVNKVTLIWRTLRSLCLPNFLTSATTCFGFATLLATDVPVIHDFGLSVAIAVMLSLLCTMLVLGPLLVLLPVPVARSWMRERAVWSSLVLRYRAVLVPVILLGSLVLAIAGENLQWSARLFDDLPKYDEARRATEDIDKSLGGTIPFELIISRPGVVEPWNEPQSLQKLDQLVQNFRGLQEVGSAVGLSDLWRFAIGNPMQPLPLSRAAIAENWFLLSMSEDSILKKFLVADASETRLSIRLRDMPGDRLASAMGVIRARAHEAFPDAEISTAGMATTVHELNNGLCRSLLTGFWQALAVIALLLMLVFRSWRWTLMAVIPNLVPAAVLIGVLALTATPMKPGVALVFSIALGIAFNNTVYLLERLRSLMRENGFSSKEAIGHALAVEGNPCLVASVCLLAGFATFLLSQFGINQTFGAYMLISLFFGLIGDLVLLPALISLCPWMLTRKVEQPHPSIMIKDQQQKNVQENWPHPEEQMSVRENDRSLQPHIAATIAAAFLTAFMPTQAVHAAPSGNDANSILKNVERGLTSKDERVLIKMKVVESNGSAKERDVEIKRKSGGKNQVLVRLKSPSDVSGVALLSVSNGSSEDQWLYMPSQKKARRVVAGNKSQRFLDTEFNLEDFSANTYARYENKLVSEERAPSAAVAIIESKAHGDDSTYSRIKTWVDLATYQVQKSEYYDHEGKLLKTMVFRDYKKFGTAWRAQTVEVRNMQTQRSTLLKIAGLKLNSGLADREFTQSALEQED